MTTALPVLRKYQLFKIATRLRSQDYSGTVRLDDTDGRIVLSFLSGKPVFATSTKVALSFPAFLLRKRRLDRPTLKQLLEESAEKGLPLDKLLVKKGVLSPKDVLRLNRELSIYVFSIAFQKDRIPYRISPDPNIADALGKPHELDLHEGVFRAAVVDRDIDFFLRMFRDRWEIALHKTADFYRYLIQFRSVFYGEDITELLMQPEPTPESVLDMAEDRESAAKQLFALCFTGMLAFKEEGLVALQEGMVPVELGDSQGQENKTVLLVNDGEDGKPITSFFEAQGVPFQTQDNVEAEPVEPDEPPDQRDDFQRFLDEGFSFGDPDPNELTGPDLEAEHTEDEIFAEDDVPGTPEPPLPEASPAEEHEDSKQPAEADQIPQPIAAPEPPAPELATPQPAPAPVTPQPAPGPVRPPPSPVTPPARPVSMDRRPSVTDNNADETQIVSPEEMFSPEPSYSPAATSTKLSDDSAVDKTQMLVFAEQQDDAAQSETPKEAPIATAAELAESGDVDGLLRRAVEEAEKAVKEGTAPPGTGMDRDEAGGEPPSAPEPEPKVAEVEEPRDRDTPVEPSEPLALQEPVPLPERPALPERGTDENLERILEDVYRSMLARNLYEILGVTPYSPISSVRDAALRLTAKYAPAQYVGYMLSRRAKTILRYVEREIERARDVLSNAQERSLYDNRINTDYGQDRRVALSFLFDAEGHYQDAIKEMEADRWTEALLLFTKAAETNPRDPEYLAFKGWATYQALRSGQSSDSFAPNKARNILERALAVDPRYQRAMLFLARLEREMNNLEAALTWFERLHRLDPSNEEVAAALDWLKMSPRRSSGGDSMWGKFKGMFGKK